MTGKTALSRDSIAQTEYYLYMKRGCFAVGWTTDRETTSLFINNATHPVQLYHNTPTRGELMIGNNASNSPLFPFAHVSQ
jgi:hypothetical protein